MQRLKLAQKLENIQDFELSREGCILLLTMEKFIKNKEKKMPKCYGCLRVTQLQANFLPGFLIVNVFSKVFTGSMHCFYDQKQSHLFRNAKFLHPITNTCTYMLKSQTDSFCRQSQNVFSSCANIGLERLLRFLGFTLYFSPEMQILQRKIFSLQKLLISLHLHDQLTICQRVHSFSILLLLHGPLMFFFRSLSALFQCTARHLFASADLLDPKV